MGETNHTKLIRGAEKKGLYEFWKGGGELFAKIGRD